MAKGAHHQAMQRILEPHRQQHLGAVDPAGRFAPVAAPEGRLTRTTRAGGSSPALRPGA